MTDAEHAISLQSFARLAEKCKDNREDLELMQSILDVMADYHRAIIRESACYLLFSQAPGDQRPFLDEHQRYDQARTSAHNLLLQNVRILNKLAQLHGLPALYTGEISERQPFRRQVADAALGLLQEMIASRA